MIFEGEKDIAHKICVLIFSTTLSERFLILRRSKQDMIKKIYIGLHVKYLLFLLDFNENLLFLKG
jgi:hypothetical protein